VPTGSSTRQNDDLFKSGLKLKGSNLIGGYSPLLYENVYVCLNYSLLGNIHVHLCVCTSLRILDEHFEEQLNELIRLCPKSRQTMLFSATMTDQVRVGG